jgi:hypothetical protein
VDTFLFCASMRESRDERQEAIFCCSFGVGKTRGYYLTSIIGKKGQGLSKKDVVKNGKNKCILYGELYTRYSEVIKEVYRILFCFVLL